MLTTVVLISLVSFKSVYGINCRTCEDNNFGNCHDPNDVGKSVTCPDGVTHCETKTGIWLNPGSTYAPMQYWRKGCYNASIPITNGEHDQDGCINYSKYDSEIKTFGKSCLCDSDDCNDHHPEFVYDENATERISCYTCQMNRPPWGNCNDQSDLGTSIQCPLGATGCYTFHGQVRNIEESSFYQRNCFFPNPYFPDVSENPCYDYSGAYNIYGQVCVCNGDNCNSSGP